MYHCVAAAAVASAALLSLTIPAGAYQWWTEDDGMGKLVQAIRETDGPEGYVPVQLLSVGSLLEFDGPVDEILDSDAVSRCLEEDGQISLSVVGFRGGQGTEVLDYVTECTAGMGGVRCRQVDKEEAAQAQEMGLPCGKYLAYLELVELGVSITPQQVGEMSMRQLRALLVENGGEEMAQGRGSQGHHGQGSGGYRGGKNGSG